MTQDQTEREKIEQLYEYSKEAEWDQWVDSIMELLTEARSQGRVEELEYIQLCERDNRESGHKWSSGDYKKFIQSELVELTPNLKEQEQ